MYHRRGRRVLGQRAHARGGEPQGGRSARRRPAHPDRAEDGLVLHVGPFARRHRVADRFRHRVGRRHHRRSARRLAGGGRTGLHYRRFAPLFSGCGKAGDARSDRDGPARRSGGAGGGPAHFQLRRRVVRLARGPPHFRQLARVRGRIPYQSLLGERRSSGARRRIHGARLLVYLGARVRRARAAGASRPDGRPTRAAKAESGEGRNPARARGLRAGRRPHAAREPLRCRARHVHLSPRIVPGREAGREGGQRERHRRRRRHDTGFVRRPAVRRRRRSFAAHRGDRARRVEKLLAEHLRRA